MLGSTSPHSAHNMTQLSCGDDLNIEGSTVHPVYNYCALIYILMYSFFKG